MTNCRSDLSPSEIDGELATLTLIVDTAERPEDIDENRAEEAIRQAGEELKHRQSRIEYEQSQATMARAMARLKVKRMS